MRIKTVWAATRTACQAVNVANMMPCTIAVWEGDQPGEVYYSTMNTGLMGTLFGGTVVRVLRMAVVVRRRRKSSARAFRAARSPLE